MKRIPDWDVALQHWAEGIVGRPYVWGETDCGTIVRTALEAMYGVDLFSEVAPPYSSRVEAVKRHGDVGGVEGALRAIGAGDVAFGFTRQGDIWIDREGDGFFPACGIVVGRSIVWATIADGVVRTNRTGQLADSMLRVPLVVSEEVARGTYLTMEEVELPQ